jgi:hypothetical protein
MIQVTGVLLGILLLFSGCEDEEGGKDSAQQVGSPAALQAKASEGYLVASWSPEIPGQCEAKSVRETLKLNNLVFHGGIEKGTRVFLESSGQTLLDAEVEQLTDSESKSSDPFESKVPPLHYSGQLGTSRIDARSAAILISRDKKCVYKISFLIIVQPALRR